MSDSNVGGVPGGSGCGLNSDQHGGKQQPGVLHGRQESVQRETRTAVGKAVVVAKAGTVLAAFADVAAVTKASAATTAIFRMARPPDAEGSLDWSGYWNVGCPQRNRMGNALHHERVSASPPETAVAQSL